MPRLKVLLLSLATLSASALAQNANPARPGTLNYIEGQAAIQGQAIASSAVGTTELQTGQTLSTTTGKAEILLTPGIFLRLGNNSAVQMVSPNLTHTEVRLTQGKANVEVDQIYPQNTILIDLPNGQTQVLKNGLYAFDAGSSTVRVFDGKAAVYPGADVQANVKPIEVKGDRQLALNGEPDKPKRFDKSASQDDLYRWSSLRSGYLGEANLNLASEYESTPGFNSGWYWAGSPFGYTWLPGDGLFWSPFGYGFYSPYYLGGGGLIYGGYGYGGYGRGGYGRGGYGYGGGRTFYHGGTVWHGGSVAAGGNTGVRTSAPTRGFSGGAAMRTGGGFSGGGGGGFHGGGGGGGHAGGGGHR